MTMVFTPVTKPSRLRWFAVKLNDSEDITRKLPPLKQVWREEDEYNLVSSLASDGRHYPALDIDIPCRYIKSSTEGHGHLYFDDLPLTWEQYVLLMSTLAAVGIIHPAYLRHSLEAGMSTLRPEHIRKKGAARKPKKKKPPKTLRNHTPDWEIPF